MQDVDAYSFLTVNDPGYAVARVYGEWKATARLSLKARVENLLDRRYQPVNGYPALGRGVFGSAEWRL
jgi:vitamin B12 transporter